MPAPKNRGLGRGLEALFGNVEIEITDNEEQTKAKVKETGPAETKENGADIKNRDSVLYIDINEIYPNRNQPRKKFDEEKITELASSILEHGLIQPVVVRKKEDGYEIVAGERRYRAARKAGLHSLPCLVRELTDEQNMLLAIIENMQREDLNPIEEAQAVEKMIKTYGLTQEEVSKSLSKSRPYISNSLRLLKLPEEIQDMIIQGSLSQGHARTLINITDEDRKISLAKRAASENLSVRELEKLAVECKKRGKPAKRSRTQNAQTASVENELKDILGTKVRLVDNGTKGRIEIEYYSRDELERLIEILRTI